MATDPAELRCITVRQPWAWAIAYGGKIIENRTGGAAKWSYRGLLGIHAASSWSRRGNLDQRVRSAWWAAHGRPHEFQGGPSMPRPERVAGFLMPIEPHGAAPIIFGAVIALAELVDAHEVLGGCCAPWGETAYEEAGGRRRTDLVHLVLENVRPLRDSIPMRGWLGLWKPEPLMGAEIMSEAGA